MINEWSHVCFQYDLPDGFLAAIRQAYQKMVSSFMESNGDDDTTTERSNAADSATESNNAADSAIESNNADDSATERSNAADSATENNNAADSATESNNADDSATESNNAADSATESNNVADNATESNNAIINTTESNTVDDTTESMNAVENSTGNQPVCQQNPAELDETIDHKLQELKELIEEATVCEAAQIEALNLQQQAATDSPGNDVEEATTESTADGAEIKREQDEELLQKLRKMLKAIKKRKVWININ